MRTSRFSLALLAGLVLLGPGRTEEYTIKIKPMEDVGKPFRVSDLVKTTGTIKVLDENGKPVQQFEPNSTEVDEYTETILEGGSRIPRKFRRAFTRAQLIAVQAGQKTTRPYPWQGRTVEYELRQGKYVVKVLGDEALKEDAVKILTGKANERTSTDFDRIFDPGKPMAVGGSWDIDPSLLETFKSQGELDRERSKGKGKLVKVYEKDGKRFGVLAIDVELAFKAIQGTRFDPPASSRIKFTLDTAIDGSSVAANIQMEGRMTGRMKLEQKGKKMLQEMSLEMSGKLVRSPGD
jgi:hypothetical protein